MQLPTINLNVFENIQTDIFDYYARYLPPDFDGIPDVTANGTNAILTCKYSKGISPQEPVWWEREGGLFLFLMTNTVKPNQLFIIDKQC